MMMQTGTASLEIAILDDHPLLSSGICALLERQPGVVATALGVSSDLLVRDHPGRDFGVVIIDPGNFATTPQETVQRLRDAFGEARLIGYSAIDNPGLARACLGHGFRAFLSRTASFAALTAAIQVVQSGALYLDPQYAEAILSSPGPMPPAPARGLTEREAYVLKSVARGKSLKEIGYELALSSKTVETYKARGTSKLNISGRREIVEYAIRSGWV
jgi:DNA-binding NarL/FixJ family response regulator